MNTNSNKKKLISFAIAGFFILTGTYNAVVINSQSEISSNDIKFVKRLDEVYGVTVPGRVVAATTSWRKLAPQNSNDSQKSESKSVIAVSSKKDVEATSEAVIPEAAVNEELNLTLVEVINPKKWQNGLKNEEFNGSLATNNGVIESLNISLPGESVSVSFSEMSGNVFEYDINGKLYSGMMYQVDQHAYMVTLTNGPLEGTRLRFSSITPEVEREQNQELLAGNNVDVGSFGNTEIVEVSPDTMLGQDQQMQQEAQTAQAFNFDQNQAI